MRRVVITGAGIVSPLGCGRDVYHDRLASGESGIGPISLFDASRYPTSIAAEVKDLDRHAVAARLGIDPRALADRKALFLVEAARQAWEEARSGGSMGDPTRLGLCLGVGVEIFCMEDIVPFADERGDVDATRLEAHLADRSPLDTFRIPADIGPRLVAELTGAEGPRRFNVGACVASAQAVGEAMRLIRRGKADVVVAGGTDSMINPLGVAGFGLLSATTTSNALGPAASRPFDRRRDGFVLGEGASALVLEEREAALARGARILGEVVGYGTSLDAYKITDPAEDGEGAMRSMARALEDAGLATSDIGYINAHGTGTPKNDRVETMAIKAVFGEAAPRMPISSTKSMMGHCIAAAGGMEIVASLMAFERGLLHATRHLEVADPDCDLDYIPGSAREARIDHFLSNSFGFGGQNATLIVRRPS